MSKADALPSQPPWRGDWGSHTGRWKKAKMAAILLPRKKKGHGGDEWMCALARIARVDKSQPKMRVSASPPAANAIMEMRSANQNTSTYAKTNTAGAARGVMDGRSHLLLRRDVPLSICSPICISSLHTLLSCWGAFRFKQLSLTPCTMLPWSLSFLAN